MRKMFIIVALLFTSLKLFAPNNQALFLYASASIQPFEGLFDAVAVVESNRDPDAYNATENACGIVQIRQIRLTDYNQRTGKNYTLDQVFDPQISKEIFMWYASYYGPYQMEKIARRWNGSGPMTETYWNKVSSQLNNT